MKSKNFIALLIFALAFTGCKLDSYPTEEEILVSNILKSQQSIYHASTNKNNLITNEIYQVSNYDNESYTQDDILSSKLYIGNLALTGYGHNHFSLSDITLDIDVDTLTQDYIFDYSGYIYDNQERYYFQTTQPFVGNAYTNPYKGRMKLTGSYQDISITVINETDVDISIYDQYNSYYDRTIHTTWHALGF